MSFYVPAPQPANRDKLGLALAGGGFRASLFHLGVLRRMAEMDLLRYVEVLSTVSGGSIVGALYILMLQERINAKARLDRNDYVALVNSLEETFVVGVQQDLRTRLLMNPLGTLSMLLSHDGLGRRMGRIYQRYIYSGAVDALRKQDPGLPRGGWLSQSLWPLSNWVWPGWISLRSLHFRPGGHETVGGLDGYNQGVLSATEPGCAIPNFIMNSTALNSAAPFRFSSVEIGDPRLGYFRHDEAKLLQARKALLETPLADLRAILDGKAALPQVSGVALTRKTAALALWWLSYNTATPELPSQFGEWTEVFRDPNSANAAEVKRVVDSMCETNFGRLRQLKLPAWYVRLGPLQRAPGSVTGGGVTGGAPAAQHLARFNQVLGEVEPAVSDQVTGAVTAQTALGKELLDFAVELYYLRSAQVMSPRLWDDFESISLATAVAASANFPPVFPPLVLLGIYDDMHVTRLGLSDGGVYDNMGITTLLDEGCTHIIASDTGAPFDVRQRVSSRYTGMIARLPAVLTDDVAEQQRTQLRERRRVSAGLAACQGGNQALRDLKDQYGLKNLAFFSIDSLNPTDDDGIPLGFSPEAVALLRTDLDSFGDLEVAALINTGYDRADRFLRAYFTQSLYSAQSQPGWNSPAVIPHPINAASAQRMSRVLTVGQSRLFRSLRLGSWLSWLFTLAAILAVLYSIGFQRLSLESLISTTIPGLILKRLETPVPRFPDWCINRVAQWLVRTPAPLWLMLVALAALLFVVFKGWPLIVDRFRSSRTANKRKVMTVVKWARAFASVLLLFVGLAPVWVAGATFVIASISYLAFNKPFLRETRMQ